MESPSTWTKSDHRAALKEIESLMHARRNTPDGERLDVLVTLVETYERNHLLLELEPLNPVEAINRQNGEGAT